VKDTRQSLLESACEVFAEKGFQDANVAEICKKADANIASINYHFGGKKKLYLEVLNRCAEVAEGEYPLRWAEREVPEPEERLARFIRGQFLRSYCDGPAGCLDRILVHEVTNPSFAHITLFRDILRERREYLRGLLRELLPPGISEPHLRVCLHNVISLFAFQKFTRARREHREKAEGPSLPAPEEMSRFATVFALGGVRALAKQAIAAGRTAAAPGAEK
jgi:TetR/AcrR family transcriptional regulator, regulator of cefoperazone and chloramphenicol sensitivity